jgi:CspA family cold shock protein
MVFRDQMLVCDQCGATFFFTVTQQRRMAEELGHQDFDAPHLCPKCRQPQDERVTAGEVQTGPAPKGRHVEPVQSAPEPVVVARPAFVPEPEPETEPEPELQTDWDLDEEPDAEQDETVEVLPAFDESLLQEFGIKIKLIGNIKWFSRKKGFGFVTKADGEELFFHRSDVQEADLRQLVDGAQVEFLVRRTGKGLEAFDVSILPTS